MLIHSSNHELLLNYLGIIKGVVFKHCITDFPINDLLFEVTINNSNNQLSINLSNIQPELKNNKHISIFKEISSTLSSLQINNELTNKDFFSNISLSIHNNLLPTPQFINFTNTFMDENKNKLSFNLNDPFHKLHIILYISSTYQNFEEQLKEISIQYKQLFSNKEYITVPLDLIILINGADDVDHISSSNDFFTTYIQNKISEISLKLKTEIFNDNTFYNNERLHIYFVSSRDLQFMNNKTINKDYWLYAIGIDTIQHVIILSKSISAQTFTCFCKKVCQFQNEPSISKSLKRIRKLGSNSNNLNYNGKLDYIYKLQLVPHSDYNGFDCKSISINSFKGSLRTKEYLEVKDIVDRFSVDNFNLNHLKTFSFIPGSECSNCKVIFKEEEYQYYCYWCKISFCTKCIEDKFNEANNIDKYFHKLHNLMYLKTKKDKTDLEDLDEYKLGKNKFSRNVILYNNHPAICNGCENYFDRSNATNPRYICITCRPGIYQEDGFNDFCYDCIMNYREKKGRYNILLNECSEHSDEHHVYLLLICSSGDYKNY